MAQQQKEFKKVIVEGILMYPSLHTPQKAFTAGDSPLYKLDLIVDAANEKLLTDAGLKPAKKQIDEDTKGPKSYPEYPGLKVFSLRKKSIKKDGTAATPPQVVDAELNNIPKEVLIGNGSKARVSISPFTFTISGKEITGHMLLGVQVLELVEYQGGNSSGSGFEKSKGFTVPKLSKELGSDDIGDESPFT